MGISYHFNLTPPVKDIIDLYKSSGINRPIDDIYRIGQMYENSNLVVSAWDEDKLVGIARSLSDFCYCCYLSDLAVRQEYKKLGIGKKLIALTKEKIGDQSMLFLLSAPSAMDYYPKINFEKVENGFIINRTR
jgi:N-acetylglutamate synthase-like GNAT family acetyltransferase